MLADVPVVGDLDDVAHAAQAHRVDVVAVVPTPGWGPRRLRRLAWDLEDSRIELAVAPALAEIAGPRLHVAPVDGIPLLRLSKPRFGGGTLLVKDLIDRLAAATALLVLGPLLLVVALLVRRDGGPVLQREERVGRRGRTFQMLTFRVTDAAAGRPTALGGVLRRYGLDGLPRLVNVACGTMALIGPPADHPVTGRADELAGWLPIKPGLIGLPQVDPDDHLSSEESVRGTLRYVEHWSATSDVSILWRTARALAGRRRRD